MAAPEPGKRLFGGGSWRLHAGRPVIAGQRWVGAWTDANRLE
jgi:hypothetical protein